MYKIDQWSRYKKSGLVSLLILTCFSSINAQNLLPEDAISKSGDLHLEIFYNQPFILGDNQLNDQIEMTSGFGIRGYGVVYSNFYIGLGTSFDYFEKSSNFNDSSFRRGRKWDFYPFIGYQIVSNKNYQWNADIGYGYTQITFKATERSINSLFVGNKNSRDYGNQISISTNFAYKLSDDVSVFIAGQLGLVKFNKLDAEQLTDFNDSSTFMSLTTGLRFKFASRSHLKKEKIKDEDYDGLSIEEKRRLYFLKKKAARRKRRESEKRNNLE